MAIARATVVSSIKPASLDTIVRRFIAGAAIEPGELVCMQSDGFIDPAIGTSVAAAQCLGVAIAPRNQGTAYAAGDQVDVVVYGPVACITGGTPGSIAYVSDTAGEVAETAGTKATIVGIVESATVLFVRPQASALA